MNKSSQGSLMMVKVSQYLFILSYTEMMWERLLGQM